MNVPETKKFFVIAITLFFSPLLLFISRRRRRVAQRSLEEGHPRILVIPQLTRIGDVVCATPVFRLIKKRYPQAFLAVLVTNRVAGIIKYNPHVDRIITYRTTGILTTIQEISSLSFEWSVNLSASAIGTALSLLGYMPMRLKLVRDGRPFSEWVTDWISTTRLCYRHHTFLPRYYVRLLESLGIESDDVEKEVVVTEEGQEIAVRTLSELGVGEGAELVGMSITAGNKIKEWGDDKFRALLESLLERFTCAVVVLGGGGDRGRITRFIETIAPSLRSRVFPVIGLPLEHLPALVKRFSLYIGVDTGPVYVAHALGVPLVDIVGPVDPAEQPPQDEKSIIVAPPPHIPPTSFVLKKRGKPSDTARALEETTPLMVLEAVEALHLLPYVG